MSSVCSSQKNVNCPSCDGRSSNPIFSSLEPAALAVLDKNKAVKLYKKGQYLFHIGSSPSGLYCINSGVVVLESEGKAGTSHIHRGFTKGGVLGYRSLFANESYSTSAFVKEDALICYLPKESVVELLHKFPDVGFNFLKHVSKELRQAESRHVNLVDKEAPKRVAETLLQLKHKFPEINWTRKEISEWADTTPETVMRCFADFKKRGFIDFEGRKVEIIDSKALVNFADLSL